MAAEHGYEWCFFRIYLRDLEIKALFDQYQLDIEANSYDQVLQDVALVASNVWPPPGVYL
ncbi:unnamed protein product [Prunus brigantina]